MQQKAKDKACANGTSTRNKVLETVMLHFGGTEVMGSKMDGNLLKAAAEAHHKAIGSIDAKGVTSAADYEAVNAALGRLVASVPKSTVMDVYNSMSKVVDSSVTNNMFSKVNPLDAVAAAKGFYTFKDVVETAQR